MPDREDFWLVLPPSLRSLPADLAASTVAVLAATVVTVVPPLNASPIRVAVALPVVLFVPGYALVAVLFPGRPSGGDSGGTSAERSEQAAGGGIDSVERVVLSVGLSLAVVVLVGLAVNFTPWGIRPAPVLGVLSVVTLALVRVGIRRRQALAPTARFRVPYRQWFGAARTAMFDPESRVDAALNLAIVLSLILAAGTLGLPGSNQATEESFTELYLLGETDEGEAVATNYPEEFSLGENRSLTVGVSNHEGGPNEYTVVAQLQTVSNGTNESRVLRKSELARFRSPVLADGETWQRVHDVRPAITGDNLRLQYLLYRGDAPQSPQAETAYRTVHLWITVEDAT